MSDKPSGPPKGEPWVWITRKLFESDAWRSQSINCRRFLDFLMLEHMGHGGKENGNLRAPHRQLEAFGVGARHITAAIREAEELGLVDCHRGGMRVATRYTLTWLPLHDGAPISDRWRTHCDPKLAPLAAGKSRNLPSDGKARLPSEGKADGRNLPTEGKADGVKNLPSEGKALSRRSYQGGCHSLDGEAEPADAARARRQARCLPMRPWPVGGRSA